MWAKSFGGSAKWLTINFLTFAITLGAEPFRACPASRQLRQAVKNGKCFGSAPHHGTRFGCHSNTHFLCTPSGLPCAHPWLLLALPCPKTTARIRWQTNRRTLGNLFLKMDIKGQQYSAGKVGWAPSGQPVRHLVRCTLCQHLHRSNRAMRQQQQQQHQRQRYQQLLLLLF